MNENLESLTELLRHTAVAHHEAFSATNGDDPAWPLWYADFLTDRLPEYLNKTPDKDTLTDLLAQLDQTFKAGGHGDDWAAYYAQSLLDRYAV